jgi:hypothetical protein
MATLEEIKSNTTTEVEAIKTVNGGEGLFKSVDGNRRELNDAEYQQHIIDRSNYLFDQQENGYKAARQEAYGSIQDQLDMMYWDNVNGTTNWQDHIAEVKSNNPKPS